MYQTLLRRIEEAAYRSEANLHRRPYRHRHIPTWSRVELLDHGPRPIARALMDTVERRSRPSAATSSSPERSMAWRDILAPFMNIDHVSQDSAPSSVERRLFAVQLEQALRPCVLTWRGLGLSLVGRCLQHTGLKTYGYHQPWSEAGFYEVYFFLTEGRSDLSPEEHDALITCARMVAYAIVTLEEARSLDELTHLKQDIQALAGDAIPVFYTPKTRTLTLRSWQSF